MEKLDCRTTNGIHMYMMLLIIVYKYIKPNQYKIIIKIETGQ